MWTTTPSAGARRWGAMPAPGGVQDCGQPTGLQAAASRLALVARLSRRCNKSAAAPAQVPVDGHGLLPDAGAHRDVHQLRGVDQAVCLHRVRPAARLRGRARAEGRALEGVLHTGAPSACPAVRRHCRSRCRSGLAPAGRDLGAGVAARSACRETARWESLQRESAPGASLTARSPRRPQVYKTGAVTSEKLKAAAVSWRDVFDEIPISVCNRCPPRCRPRGALDAARLHVAHRLRKKPAQNRACTEARAKVGRVGAASAPSKAGGAKGAARRAARWARR